MKHKGFYKFLSFRPKRLVQGKFPTPITEMIEPMAPQVPNDCCMSGCVYCVWDQFADEAKEYEKKTGKKINHPMIF